MYVKLKKIRYYLSGHQLSLWWMDFYDIYGFESFDKTCIEDYISIPKDKRHKNTAFMINYLIKI